ncbi:MAG TPA: LacI family DNA-binding transcriptional regulator [Candidatus Limnocylindria bacterium]|nr:LacI family DNA-binding transcriptional regulator [Candidatus Limnocylindria bacterium]
MRKATATSNRRHHAGGQAVTLDAVARAAGVSRATVSRVVNGSPKVTPVVRQAVERAVGRLGYVPNPAARSLVTRRSGFIALVIPEQTTSLFGDPFFPRLLVGISGELAASNVQLVLMIAQGSAQSRAEAYVAAGHVDGALLASLHGDDGLPDRLRTRGVPVVVGGRPPTTSMASYVDVDNESGARTAVEHLLEGRRRRVATITGPLDMAVGVDRRAGYRHALAAAGIAQDDGLEADGQFTQEGGAAAMRAILARHPDVDAVFAASDLMAIGAMGELRRAGRRVPVDVAVVGFDDSAMAAASEPPLTSIRQPIEEMGREMTRLLLEAIETRSPIPKQVLLGTSLVVRESSAATMELRSA